jgi:hypothetical protein
VSVVFRFLLSMKTAIYVLLAINIFITKLLQRGKIMASDTRGPWGNRQTAAKASFYLAASLCSAVALAAPPEGANPAFKQYFESLKTKEGYGCCSIADCRPVPMEMRNGSPWVFIDRKTFGEKSGAPDDWLKVPAEAYGAHNQTANGDQPERPPQAVVCWTGSLQYDPGIRDRNPPSSHIRCFDCPLPETRNRLMNHSLG